jgi:hypothetical protein
MKNRDLHSASLTCVKMHYGATSSSPYKISAVDQLRPLANVFGHVCALIQEHRQLDAQFTLDASVDSYHTLTYTASPASREAL